MIKVPITHKTLVRAPQKDVFDAMTKPHLLNQWFTEGTTADLINGGELILRWKDWGPDKVTTEATCPIVTYQPSSKFVFKWWEDHYTTVSIHFQKLSDSETLVLLSEEGYEDNEEGWRRCLECATGWGEAITLLKIFVEHGISYK